MTRDLAGGWRQRLALGCAILHEPRIVFLDEPTGGVDPVSRREFWRLIDTLARGGTTVLVTTHYLDEAEHCHRIAVISAGRLAALGTTAELRRASPSADRGIPRGPARAADAGARRDCQRSRRPALFGTAVHAVLRSRSVDVAALASTLAAEGTPSARSSRSSPRSRTCSSTSWRGRAS